MVNERVPRVLEERLMKKPLVLAALSGLILVGAAYPDFDKPDDDGAVTADRGGGERYRPCRSRRDDNCIQLYERGVSARYARWLRDGDPGYDQAVRYAVYEDHAGRRGGARRGHRERFADAGGHHRDHAGGHHRDHHAATAAPPRPHRARRPNTRLAMVDVLRCDDRAAPRQIVRERVRREVIRAGPRPRMREDSGVRGM
jgi:hypothetical protein